VALLWLALGPADIFAQLATFFSVMAVVTFGGAYAVLAYVADAAVTAYQWLAPGEMLDGLALAETTPGPLILVLSFVGYMAAFRHSGAIDPGLAGVAGGLLVAWVTFLPSFLWIFLGAPFMERLRGNARLSGALSAITAAVVGVIANLALWFALHVFFRDVQTVGAGPVRLAAPVWGSVDLLAVLVFLVAAISLFVLRIGLLATLGLAAAAGIAGVLAFPGGIPI
jgi:chromate transporter